MNKKGFTLIELISVIVVISIIALVGGVSVSRFIKKASNQAYKNIEETMKSAAKSYILKGNDVGVVTAETLINENFMDTPIDPKDKKSCYVKKSYVDVTKENINTNQKYNYDVCLICGDNYRSEYCEDVESDIISVSYRELNSGDFINLSNNEFINMKKNYSLQIKYLVNSKTSVNFGYEFVDNELCSGYTISGFDNNSFVLKTDSTASSGCQIKVFDTNTESNVKESTFTINITDEDSNTIETDTRLVVTYNNSSVADYKTLDSIVDFSSSTKSVAIKFRIEDINGNVLEDETRALTYELINNQNANGDSCISLWSGASTSATGSYLAQSVGLSHQTDGCSDVTLIVKDGSDNIIKSYLVNYINYTHITSMKLSKKTIEVEGKYSSSIPESYYTQEIMFEPSNADIKNFVCEIPSDYMDNIQCDLYQDSQTKKWYVKIYGNNVPTLEGEYAYLKLKNDDSLSTARDITLKVRVNNVVPNRLSVNFHSYNRLQTNVNYFCAGKGAISFELYPNNAFGSIVVQDDDVSVSALTTEKLLSSKILSQDGDSYIISVKNFDSSLRPVLNVNNLKVCNSYGSYSDNPKCVENSASLITYPAGHTFLNTKYCN